MKPSLQQLALISALPLALISCLSAPMKLLAETLQDFPMSNVQSSQIPPTSSSSYDLRSLRLTKGGFVPSFLTRAMAYFPTSSSDFDPPKSPLKRGTLAPVSPLKRETLAPVSPLKRETLAPVPPLLRGARGDRTLVAAISFTPPPPPPDRSAPGNRGEGASRGCIAGNQPLTALVPIYEQTLDANQGTITQVWGLTSAEHPRFWFYVPYESNSVRAIEFVLQDDRDETLYRTSVSIPSKVGIVGVQVPSTANPLEPNRQYHWFFKVRAACDPNQPETLEYVEGWVQRQSLDAALRDRISQASPQQRAALYAEKGIWHDALTTLAQQRSANPKDGAIAKDWMDLLRAVGLENLANQPLLE